MCMCGVYAHFCICIMTLFLAEQIALLQIARTLVAVLDEIVEDITEDPNQIINDGMNNNDIAGVM